MDEHSSPFLVSVIEKATRQLLQRAEGKKAGTVTDSLIFMGNPHETVPRQLLLDTQLNPREKFTWQFIRLQADKGGGAFPDYDTLQIWLSNYPMVKKASRGTVSQTLLMLRLTRWLSLCHRARDKSSGRVLGNVYVLHDEPLSPLDAQAFDPDYLSLLLHCLNHAHPRLRATAEELLLLIHQDDNLRYLSSRLGWLEERMIGQQTTESVLQSEFSERTGEIAGFAEETGQNSLSSLREPGQKIPPGTATDSVLPENPALRSSSIYKILLQVPRARDIPWPTALNLTRNEQQITQKLLQTLPETLAQAVLEDVAQRVTRGGIQNPAAYLLATVKKARLGEFNALGREPVKTPLPPVSEAQPETPVRRSEPQHVATLLADIRKKYGLGKGKSR